MVAVERLWPSSTVVCVAPGPSLTAADCAFVRGRARVIAINHAVTVAPWADVLYSSDRSWWERHHAMPFAGLRFSIGSRRSQANPYVMCPSIQVLQHTGDTGLELARTGLRTGRNSGYAAINLAVHLGATRILLLGYNLGRVRGRAHFYAADRGIDSPYHDFLADFATIVGPLKAIGVEVLNCTDESHLTVFPRANVRDVLADSSEVAA